MEESEKHQRLQSRRDDLDSLLSARYKLKNDFYKSYDPSIISAFIQTYRTRPHVLAGDLLGEGSHFSVYKMKTAPDRYLAISIAKAKFVETFQLTKKPWTDLLSIAKKIDHPLIPPMETYYADDILAYIQPCCLAGPFLVKTSMIAQLSRSLDEALHKRRLRLVDGHQIMCCAGVPLVVDWSDLVLL